jgi:hypothetical protein
MYINIFVYKCIGENVVQAMRRLSGNQSNNGSKIKKRGVKKDIAEVKALTQVYIYIYIYVCIYIYTIIRNTKDPYQYS